MYKIAFLLDKKNNWIKKYFKKNKFISNKNFRFIFIYDEKLIKNFDVLFIINYTKIINQNILKLSKLNLLIHESNLPKGKGFAPVQWQILNNKSKIPVKLIEATQKVDSGDIYGETNFTVKKTYLNDEIREQQANASIKLISNFLKKYPKIKKKKQKGEETFYLRRTKKDSELNPNKTILDNFNLMRICDNKKYPAFFRYKNEFFYIKIYKKKS